MRIPFRSQSRLNLVLYRTKWGNTPWTGVEAAAIKDSCLATSFKNIFFFVIEPTTEIPTWLPETHVRFNYADFTLEQAVGAVKARVQERGGHFKPMTPSRKVQLLQVEEEYQCDRRNISSNQGMRDIQENIKLLFEEIVTELGEVNSSGHLKIEHQLSTRSGDLNQSCIFGTQTLGMAVIWIQRYVNELGDNAALLVREFNGNLMIPPGYVRFRDPDMLNERKYDPDISRAREYVWRLKTGNKELISGKDLAAKIVLQFLDLVERDRAGKIKRERW